MRIEVTDGKIETREGTIKSGPRAGQQYKIRTQEAYAHNGHAYPARFKLSLPDDVAGYSPGFYTIAPDSFVVGDFDSLGLARSLRLLREEAKPVAVSKAS